MGMALRKVRYYKEESYLRTKGKNNLFFELSHSSTIFECLVKCFVV